MIVKNLGTHYQVELFNVVYLNKDDPRKSWLEYIKDITTELDREVTRVQYNLNIPAAQSHVIVPDKSEGEKGILDAIHKKYEYV